MTSRNRLGETRLILIGAAVLLSLGMGIRQSFGLFLTPVTRDLALTAADFTLAVAVQNIVWGISQAPIGAIADRFGLRATMMAGAAIYVVGLAVMAAAEPIEPRDRSAFLRAVASELARHPDPGDGDVHRAVSAIQRRFRDPPDPRTAGTGKWA